MTDDRSKKLELDDDDLDEVTGGNTGSTLPCPYFFKAANKLNINNCNNCFYWTGPVGQKNCSSPQKNKNLV